jgi:hypothetical protein
MAKCNNGKGLKSNLYFTKSYNVELIKFKNVLNNYYSGRYNIWIGLVYNYLSRYETQIGVENIIVC